MARQSERGRMVPPRVFSREMSRVGAKWSSSSRMACFWTSERVMLWSFAGVTGMGIPPLILAIPPASLTVMSAIIVSPFGKDEIRGKKRGGTNQAMTWLRASARIL